MSNYAFIDSQNLNITILKSGWELDWRKFRVYLNDKYQVKKAFLFIGFVSRNRSLYKKLENYGYILIFKKILEISGEIKGNIDAELVLHCVIQTPNYEKAIIVSNDGDFTCLVEYLISIDKFKCLLSPNVKRCSALLKKTCGGKLYCLNQIRNKLQ